MRLGVCYYPEQWPEDRWQVDAKLMHNLGLKIVRIGEFSWSKLEPAKGNYVWDHLDALIDILSSEGLEVVLATPTAKPPLWLVNENPDVRVLSRNVSDAKSKFGIPICVNNPALIEYSFNIVSEMAKRYGGIPQVIGWQVDNKFHIDSRARCYCENCARSFRLWLKNKYHSIEQLNRDWGTPYWGEEFVDWDQVSPPEQSSGYFNPSYKLDYQRFCSDTFARYQKLQIDTIKAYSTRQFVTHNFDFANYEIDYFKLGADLDFVSWNSFPTAQSENLSKFLYEPREQIPDFVYDVGDPYITGFLHCCTRGYKNSPFWVMEQQCGQIDAGSINPGVRIGVLRLWAWHAVTSGAEAILFSRWRASRHSAEQLEAGLLGHDGIPSNGFHEIANMLPESPVLEQLDEIPLESEVAILTRYDDMWALKDDSHRKDFSYLRQVFRYFRVLTSLGVSVDITTYDADFSNYRLLIVPILYLSDPDLVSKLESFVAQGGSVLFGPRSGFKNESNIVIEESLPGLLLNLVGGKVQNWQSLPDFVRFSIRSEIAELSGEAGVWIEAIAPQEDEAVNTLVRYLGGPLAGKAAMTVHAFGAGNVYYLGFYPTFEQLKAIIKYLVQHEGNGQVLDLPDGVIVNQRGKNRVAFNFTRNEKTFVVDEKLVTLPPRDFRFNLRD
jgi:beta-galactosidase